MFSEFDACINLGGFANISFEDKGKRIAFDICPVNIVLNYYSNQLGFSYDDRGTLAKSGEVCETLLTALNEIPFYKMNPPKSLGLEWVHAFIFPILKKYEKPVASYYFKNFFRTYRSANINYYRTV